MKKLALPSQDIGPAVSDLELDAAKISAARLWACNKWPYLAHAILAMQPVAAPGLGRFAVDEGWQVHLDPAAVAVWTPSQLGFVLNHVAQHLLRDHAGRARGFGVDYEQRLAWNAAADAEINHDLIRGMPRDDRRLLAPLTPKQLELEPGKLAEYYFTQLRDLNPSVPDEGSGVHGHGGQDGQGEPGGQQTSGGEPAESDGSTEPAVSAAEAEMLRQATAEAILAEGVGTVAGGLERWARARMGQSQDWRSLLSSSLRTQIAQAAGLADYSYRRLSRRAGAVPDVVLPAMVKSPVNVAIVVDTSGSVRLNELGDALRETRSITRQVTARGGSVQVLACDAVVTRASTSTDGSMALTGGGGTDMAAGIEAALSETPRPQAVVVLTDGLTPWPDAEPSVPVIIGLLGNRKKATTPNWATTIEIEPSPKD